MTRQDRYTWKLKRMGKAITLKEISSALNYSISMISKFENSKIEMIEEKITEYKQYIENKEV